MSVVILDAWALLAWLQGELPAANAVDDLLQRAEGRDVRLLLSIVNAGEVFWATAEAMAKAPLSYADAFAVALALREGAPVATGDPEIVATRVTLGVEVFELSRAWRPPRRPDPADRSAASTKRMERTGRRTRARVPTSGPAP